MNKNENHNKIKEKKNNTSNQITKTHQEKVSEIKNNNERKRDQKREIHAELVKRKSVLTPQIFFHGE